MSEALLMTGAARDTSSRPYAIGIMAAVGITLCARALQLLLSAIWAIRYPYALDYGEGVVWQQMRHMFTERAYGPIDGFPAIVFHYPPIYHAVTRGLANLAQVDELAAGRIVSLAGLLVAIFVIGVLTFRAARSEMDRTTALVCSGVAGLAILSTWPVLLWTPVMRVDFLALALSFGGLYFADRALKQPGAVHVAALLFVLALYTKQSTIAAPAAAFAVLLFLRPRVGLIGIASAFLMGLVMMAGLWWATEGRIVHHLFLYNINRFEAVYLLRILEVVGMHAAFFAIAWIAARARLSPLLAEFRAAAGVADFKRRLLEGPAGSTLILLLAYLGATTLMLPLLAKSGSSYNYFIEWICAVCVFVGLGLRDLIDFAVRNRKPAASRVSTLHLLLALALLGQLALLPADRYDRLRDRPDDRELAALSAMIKSAPRPVISEDMVLLVRNGREVVWETAIFAELAGTGKFDERAYIRKIRDREFSFFITEGIRGDEIFDSRYNPEVADALDEAYPHKQALAGLVIHLPEL